MLANSYSEKYRFHPKSEYSHKYKAYGLTIYSDFYLPELTTSDDEANVFIRKGIIEDMPAEASGCYSYYNATDHGIYLAWEGVGAFLVRNGCEMVVDPFQGVEERIIRLFILGTSLAMLLHQRRNTIVLHASVVAMNGAAIAFVGDKGAGKSTIAGTLHRRGHTLIADDILAVDISEGNVNALPGFPHLKLWPDSIESLGFSPDTLPRLRPELDKRSYRLFNGFSETALPLKSIYILENGPETTVNTLQPQQALLGLMPHWYGARFGTEFLRNLGLSNHFKQCTKLVNRTSVFRLERPRSMQILPEVACQIEGQY